MDNLFLAKTKSTPEINFDKNKNYLKIEGESYPENSFEFYEPIFEWLEKYLKEIKNETVILDISLSYLNTSSTKSIMCILDILEESYEDDKNIIINWYYEKENELSYEIAEDFKEYLEIPLNLVEKNINS